MNYRELGSTGITVSEIGYGTWGLTGGAYGSVRLENSERCLIHAFENGITLYDTADLYGNGASEILIGKQLGSVRKKIVIISKGGMLPHDTFVMPQNFSPKYIQKALDNSLMRLATDYLDIYLLHSPKLEDMQNNDALIGLLEKAVASGSIKAFGISARSPGDALTFLNEYPIKVLEVNFNIIDQRVLDIGLLALAREKGVGIIARTPLSFGYLSGCLNGYEAFETGDHRANWPESQRKRWAAGYKMFDFLSEGTNRTPAQAALKFCLSYPEISSVIPGMLEIRHIDENIASSDLHKLEFEELLEVRRLYALHQHEFFDVSLARGR